MYVREQVYISNEFEIFVNQQYDLYRKKFNILIKLITRKSLIMLLVSLECKQHTVYRGTQAEYILFYSISFYSIRNASTGLQWRST